MKTPVLSFLYPTLALATLLATGCSGRTEDVRFTLCKEVTERLLESMGSVTWQDQTSEIRREGDAATRLRFTIGGESETLSSACFYKHNSPEESALDHVNPLAAFSTLPYAMIVNGERVPDALLKKAVSAEQIEGFRDFADRVESEIRKL